MPRYLIEAPHDPSYAACLRVLDSVLRAGAHYLTKVDWGCEDGVHAAWMVVEAQNHDDARLMVPPILRRAAKVVQLNKFTPEQIADLHTDRA